MHPTRQLLVGADLGGVDSGSIRPRSRRAGRTRPRDRSAASRSSRRGSTRSRTSCISGRWTSRPRTACRRPRANRRTAGTAEATCLPCLRTSIQCRAWLGASVATNTASILSSLTRLLERRIGLLAAAGLRQCRAPIGEEVADGHDFDVRVVLEAERRAELARAVPDDPHADLAVGDRFPLFRGIRIGRRLLETRDRLLLLLSEGRPAEPQSRGAKANGLQERTS